MIKFNICCLSVNRLKIIYFIILLLEQYAAEMLEIKEVMDNVLAKQKAERDPHAAEKLSPCATTIEPGALELMLCNKRSL